MVSSVVTLFVCALAVGQATAEARPASGNETVDRFAGRSALVVEGARSYAAGKIARALAVSPRFVIVSHPRAPLADYLRFIEENVRLGYLRGGFPDAAVKASPDGESGVLRVVVEEGRRLQAGPVVVHGWKALTVDTITKAVSEPDPDRKHEARWQPGEPAKLDPPFLAIARQLVERAYAREGYLAPEVEVAVEAGEADTASLVIRVLAEGSPSTLGEVLFQGTLTDDLQALASAVGIRPGMTLDQGTLDALETKLESLGRYLEVDVEPVPIGDSGRTDLKVKLVQADFAPPLGEPAPEHQGMLRQAFRWLGDASHWKGVLVFRADAAGVIRQLGLGAWLERALFEIGVASDGLLIQARYRRIGRDLEEKVGLVVSGNRGVLVAAPLSLVSRFDLTGGPTLLANIGIAPTRSGDKEPLKFTAGVAMRKTRPGEPRFQLHLEVHETALTHLSRWRRLAYRLDGDRLHVDHVPEDGEPARIASAHRETGAVEFGFRREQSGLELSLSFEESGLEGRLVATDEEARKLGYKEASPVQFLALSGIGAARFARFVKGRRDGAQLKCLEAVLAGLLRNEAEVSAYLEEPLLGDASPGKGDAEHFPIPHPDLVDPGWSAVFGVLASYLAADMPRESWLQALFREAACIGGGESPYTQDELKRLFGSPEVGPVGYWVFAEVLGTLGSAHSTRFAEAALRESTLEGFRKELRVLRREGSLPARIIAGLGRSLQELDEAAVASVLAGTERLGDDDEREFARLFDAARRVQDRMEAGASLLEAFWVSGLDDFVRSRCEGLVSPMRSR